MAALRAIDRAVPLVERHLRLAEVLEAHRRTQHLVGTRLYAELAADALRLEVLYRVRSGGFERGVANVDSGIRHVGEAAVEYLLVCGFSRERGTCGGSSDQEAAARYAF